MDVSAAMVPCFDLQRTAILPTLTSMLRLRLVFVCAHFLFFQHVFQAKFAEIYLHVNRYVY